MTILPPASDNAPLDQTQVAVGKPTKSKPSKAPKAPKAAKLPKRARAPGRVSGWLGSLFNLLTVLFLFLTCVSGGLVAALFQEPSPLRFIPGGSFYMLATDLPVETVLLTPTPPAGTSSSSFPTLPPAWTATNTPTITPTPLPGTPSPEPSGTVPLPTYTATFTPSPTATATKPSPTPTRTGPTPRPTVTRSVFAYTMQNGSPAYLAQFVFGSGGCNWFGITGNVYDLAGNPVINLTIHVDGGGINTDVLTGSLGQGAYAHGYVIQLSDHPIETTDIYHIQLRTNTSTPLSDIYSLRTYGDCNKNQLLVNFTQNH